jgi:hypothetical protein
VITAASLVVAVAGLGVWLGVQFGWGDDDRG